MNVLLISQCHKNALKQTRRILDQFAERRGERTWQTAITWQGLDTLRRLLKQTARRNTAVACHWIRGKDHSELLWIVGNTGAFNQQGAVPTGSTEQDVLRARDENDWPNAAAIRLLAALAALFHDLGKANATFQAKLDPGKRRPPADPLRHEWVSLRLLEAFVAGQDDRQWLARLAELPASPDLAWLKRLVKDTNEGHQPSPFCTLRNLASALGWLIVSHHRLPYDPELKPVSSGGQAPSAEDLQQQPASIYATWCGASLAAGVRQGRERRDWEKALADCWVFKHDPPLTSQAWQGRARRLARRALDSPGFLETNWLDNPQVMHLARLTLMLADHHYSSLEDSQERVQGDPGYPLWANTRRKNGQYNQGLDEHLLGVENQIGRIVRALPRLPLELPRLARHRGFKQRSRDPRFQWQDKAYDLAASLRKASQDQGFFGLNMASTGCGKTLANGRIMYALAEPLQGARFTLALGLRILTLQTGQAYRRRLGLGPDDLAVLVGGRAGQELYERNQQYPSPDQQGSESAADLMPEDSYLHYEGSLEPGPLSKWLAMKSEARRLLNAPILACTIDHLAPATEGLRGGRQIAPMLRLMSADLVLDEPDDFGLEDLPALTRLVHWSGLLGCRVLLSSATLPPSLAQGLFAAYLEGRRAFHANRNVTGRPLEVCCAWFDEFACLSGRHAEGESFQEQHRRWVERRLRALEAKAEVRRRARIVPLDVAGDESELSAGMARVVQEGACQLHAEHHSRDPRSGKRVSFGLVRLANIHPLVLVTRALAGLTPPPGLRLHLCCYHSQHPLLVRSALERRLDRLLNRQDAERVFADPELRKVLDNRQEPDQLFLVLASPVAEVGRDHDYDWAVVEPSSLRSIIQLAGRVRRHRAGACQSPNVLLLETNWQSMEKGSNEPAFCRPGFEDRNFPLRSHRLGDLLRPEQYEVLSSAPRIAAPPDPHPQDNLADLEHARLAATMLDDPQKRVSPVTRWWTPQAHLSGQLQRAFPFRYEADGMRDTYALIPDEDTGELEFKRREEDGSYTPQQGCLHPEDLSQAERVELWGETDYPTLLDELALGLDMEPAACARRFGALDLRSREAGRGWLYHPALGFCRRR